MIRWWEIEDEKEKLAVIIGSCTIIPLPLSKWRHPVPGWPDRPHP